MISVDDLEYHDLLHRNWIIAFDVYNIKKLNIKLYLFLKHV